MSAVQILGRKDCRISSLYPLYRDATTCPVDVDINFATLVEEISGTANACKELTHLASMRNSGHHSSFQVFKDLLVRLQD